jgi:predicted esterase
MRRLIFASVLTVSFSSVGGAQDQALDRAFEQYWAADSVKDRDKASERILATGASFGTVLERLATGRVYKAGVETGEVSWVTLPGGGPRHSTTLVIPSSYIPTVKYPVRVYLHGGVARPDPTEADDSESLVPNRPARPRRRLSFKPTCIAVYPVGYADAQWWFQNQMDNFDAILDRLKRTYNIDENRVHLMGVSDGGTGAYYAGLKNPTPWSVFYPLNGFLGVLANPMVRADGELFTSNLVNRPIYAINGENDPLYPVSAVVPWLVMLKQAGATLAFRPMAGAGHDTSWWANEVDGIDAFEESHPRDPHPTALSWETERVDRSNRFAWLTIDALDPKKGGAAFPPNNTIEIQEPLDFGLRVDSRNADGRKVIDVIEGTSSAAMGLRKGDTIVRMDDLMVRTAGDLGRAFEAHKAGTPMEFEIARKGTRLTMNAVFPPPPKPSVRKEAFAHRKPSGRVDIARKGNAFEAKTRGVAAFTLLLAPDVIDFDQPVVVTVDGRRVFDGKVERSAATLLRHAARDDDRTMLYGAELKIAVP